MSFELQAVAYSSLILFVLILVQGTLVPLNQGFAWGLGSRDAKRDSTALQARASRTIANHIEGMLLFVPFAFLIDDLALAFFAKQLCPQLIFQFFDLQTHRRL